MLLKMAEALEKPLFDCSKTSSFDDGPIQFSSNDICPIWAFRIGRNNEVIEKLIKEHCSIDQVCF
jgi:hypothetical protein